MPPSAEEQFFQLPDDSALCCDGSPCDQTLMCQELGTPCNEDDDSSRTSSDASAACQVRLTGRGSANLWLQCGLCFLTVTLWQWWLIVANKRALNLPRSCDLFCFEGARRQSCHSCGVPSCLYERQLHRSGSSGSRSGAAAGRSKPGAAWAPAWLRRAMRRHSHQAAGGRLHH